MSTTTTTHKTPIPTRNDLLQAALELASMGYPVFPCIPNNKEPATEHGFKDATTDEEKITAWWADRGNANIGIATEGLVVLDVDKDVGAPENPWLASLSPEQLADLQRAPLARTPRGGRHYVFRQNGRAVPCSTSGVAGQVDIKANGGYIVAAPSFLNCKKDGKPIRGSYAWAVALEPVSQLTPVPTWLESLAIEQPHKRGASAKPNSGAASDGTIPDGQRNQTLFDMGRQLRCVGFTADAILNALLAANAKQCKPPLDDDEVRRIAGSASKEANVSGIIGSFGAKQGQDVAALPEPMPWPTLDPAAMYGVMGDVVRTIEPQTEADPVAILVQGLVWFGNMAGRSAHYIVEGTPHHTNMFTVQAGDTSRGRKGTSGDRVRQVFQTVDDLYTSELVKSGLSSGEGLIWHVRDAITKQEAVREKGSVVAYRAVESDPGVTDKRLLVVENEFASVLRIAKRDGNTLSPTLRSAWDSGHLRTLSKNSPATATDAHISIIGHITKEELLAALYVRTVAVVHTQNNARH